jgi:hypothetical protein
MVFKTRGMRVAAALVVFAAGAVIAFAAGGGTTAVSVYTTDAEDAPAITRISPQAGCAGNPVDIKGEKFTGATSVDFNGAGANFKVINDTHIRALVPSVFTKGPIHVTTPFGTATSPNNFGVKCK